MAPDAFDIKNIQIYKHKNNLKQAGAELGQAQFKLGLAKVAIAM